MNFLRPYLRGWPILVGAMILAFTIASKYLKYVTPMYESTAKLRIADMNEGIPNSNLFKDLDVFATTQKINAEIELLKSHALLKKALGKVSFGVQIFRSGSLRTTELYNESPIIITPIDWSDKLKDKTYKLTLLANQKFSITTENGRVYNGKLGDTISIENGLTLIQLNTALVATKSNLKIEDNYVFTVLSQAKQISQISNHLDIISVDKDVPVIRISYKSSHPDKAADFPNALAQAYIEDYIESKYGAANITVNFLDQRIAEIGDKLSNSEQMILNYRDDKHITNIRQETETDLRKISQLKIQKTNLKMSLEAIRDLEKYIQSGKKNFLDLAPNFEAFTDLLSTEIVKKIKQLQAEKKDLLLQYTEKDEKVLVIDAKIDDLIAYLIESITNTRKNLEVKYEKLENDIATAEEVFVDVPEKERMMTILNREFEIYQQSYNFLNQKKIESEIARAAKIAFHRIITPASTSKDPVSPNRIIIKAVATILGLMAAVVFIFLVHALKGRVNNLETVESKSMVPVLMAVPKLKTTADKENFFIKTLNDWEVKNLIKENDLICFSAFNKLHGSHFMVDQISQIMRLQNRSVLIIEILNSAERSSFHPFEEVAVDAFTQKLTLSNDQLKSLTSKAWQAFLKDKANKYDCTFLINSNFGESHTIASMAAANLNIVCVDTRLTPAKRIEDVDLIQHEYQLPNLFFALNRVGYRPSLFSESIKWISTMINQLKRNK